MRTNITLCFMPQVLNALRREAGKTSGGISAYLSKLFMESIKDKDPEMRALLQAIAVIEGEKHVGTKKARKK